MTIISLDKSKMSRPYNGKLLPEWEAWMSRVGLNPNVIPADGVITIDTETGIAAHEMLLGQLDPLTGKAARRAVETALIEPILPMPELRVEGMRTLGATLYLGSHELHGSPAARFVIASKIVDVIGMIEDQEPAWLDEARSMRIKIDPVTEPSDGIRVRAEVLVP